MAIAMQSSRVIELLTCISDNNSLYPSRDKKDFYPEFIRRCNLGSSLQLENHEKRGWP